MENTFETEKIEMPEVIAEQTETTEAETISFEEEDVTGDVVEENPDHDHVSEEEHEHVSEEELFSQEEEEATDSVEEA